MNESIQKFRKFNCLLIKAFVHSTMDVKIINVFNLVFMRISEQCKPLRLPSNL